MLGSGPVYVSEELAACQSVLSCGDAAATPCRLRASPLARSAAAISLAAKAGKLARSSDGRRRRCAALVDGDAAAAASVVDELTPRLVVDLGAGLSAAFIGRCDATLENRASDAGKAATVAVYVDRSDELASPVGAVVFVTAGAGDLAAAAEAVDDTLRLGATPAVAAAAHSTRWERASPASATHGRRARATLVLGRASRTARRRCCSPETVGVKVVKDRALSAFSRGWLHGPDAAPTEAQTVRARTRRPQYAAARPLLRRANRRWTGWSWRTGARRRRRV